MNTQLNQVAPRQAPSSAEVDPRALRNALGSFATGVTVMTAQAGGRKVGVTANSFNSVSLEPPLILWSISKKSSSFEVFEAADFFAVNILAHDQTRLSNHFARPSGSVDKFADVAAEKGPGGCLVIAQCSASFQCRKHAIVDGGDHWILIGMVVDLHDSGRDPLLFHRGKYVSLAPHPESFPPGGYWIDFFGSN